MDALGTPGKIITFYSYKGGTGRSMALANVACLLARRAGSDERPILMVDWDLEAPGLHRFFRDQFRRRLTGAVDLDHALDEQPGLINLFSELNLALRAGSEAPGMHSEEALSRLFDEVGLERFVLQTDNPSLRLLKAGRFDETYSQLVNTFEWEAFYDRSPGLIRAFAERLAEEYRYVLIDSRTGLTDTSGVCTMLMPEKLVVVFTPNRQSLLGGIDVARRAITYRQQSDDLRPLIVFPLASRIELNEEELRKRWREGSPDGTLIGYEERFRTLFSDLYNLEECRLGAYFNQAQIPQRPRYAYGEEIAAIVDRPGDTLSLTLHYESFVDQLVDLSVPWESGTPADRRPRAVLSEMSARESVVEDDRPAPPAPARRRTWVGIAGLAGGLLLVGVLGALLSRPLTSMFATTPTSTPIAALGDIPTQTATVQVVGIITPSGTTPTPTPARGQEIIPTPVPQVAAAPTPTPTLAPPPTPRPLPTASPTPRARARVVVPDQTYVNLRETPSLTGAIIRTVSHGVTVEIIGDDREADGIVWRNVSDLAGVGGWISVEFLTPA